MASGTIGSFDASAGPATSVRATKAPRQMSRVRRIAHLSFAWLHWPPQPALKNTKAAKRARNSCESRVPLIPQEPSDPYDPGVTALPARAPGRDVRVLVVDDEPMVLEVVSRYLERDGYIVDAAADGAEALEMFERRPPHLVILDLMLPSIPGLEVLRELRRRSDVP